MKTERLYYNDPYLFEFDATILEARSLANRIGVVLDKTAFYPTSGGQPNDLGTINDAAVIDCIEDEDTGTVIHLVDRELVSGPVHCRIDGVRRADHMQQHSGQHVLSQAFVELFDWPTVSFHMGAATSRSTCLRNRSHENRRSTLRISPTVSFATTGMFRYATLLRRILRRPACERRRSAPAKSELSTFRVTTGPHAAERMCA